jgi:transketolase
MESLRRFLEYKAYRMRVNSLRATTAAGSGHPTSCLSAADIVAVLFLRLCILMSRIR